MVIAIAGLALYFWQSSDAAASSGAASDPGVDPTGGTGSAYTVDPKAPIAQIPADQRLAAFLATIRQFESGNRYNVITGGQTFSDYSQHPQIKVWFYNPRKPGPAGVVNDWSDAAGAYQMISTTFAQAQRALGLPDFSPDSQDAAAAWILQNLGVPALLNNGNIADAFVRASGTWAALPGSTAGQGAQSLQAALELFSTFLPA